MGRKRDGEMGRWGDRERGRRGHRDHFRRPGSPGLRASASQIAVLWVLLWFCTGCLLPDDPAKERVERAESAKGDIVVGAVAHWSTIDVMLWEGIELGVEEINAQGGVLGRKIRLIKRDDEGSVQKGVAIAQEFSMNTDLVAVVGHYQSFVSLPASVVYQYYGVFMLCTVDTDPDLTQQGFPLIFRAVPGDPTYGKALAEFCRRKGLARWVFFLEADESGRDFANAFVTASGSAAMDILEQQSFDALSTREEIHGTLQRWKDRYDFDAILISGKLPQAAVVVREARRIGLNQAIVGSTELDRRELLKYVDDRTRDVFVATDFNPGANSSEVRRFMKAFQTRYGKAPDMMAAHGYDTVACLRYAVQKANSTVPSRMAQALRTAENLKGVTGSLRFSPGGARLAQQIYIKTLENGEFIFLKNNSDAKDIGTSKP